MISTDTKQIDLERELIADFIFHPDDSRHWAAYYPVRVDAFTDPTLASVFQKLLASEETDQGKLSRLVYDALGIGKNGKEQNSLLDCATQNIGLIPVLFHDLAMRDYMREQRKVLSIATATISDCATASTCDSKLKHAIDSVIKPNDVPMSLSAAVTDGTADVGKIDEFPAYILHVPGFIDEFTAHALKTARVPNLTLAFAAAISLLSHLAGRTFTTDDGTWTNLYVFALADTGQGKEDFRRIIKDALRVCNLSNTFAEQVASGEAVDDLIGGTPRILLLIDEVQKVVQTFGNRTLTNMQSLIKTLMNLYTSSGSTYTTRAMASRHARPIAVDNPSLSIFATGNAVGVYESLTPESIDEGLVGRCLMFDTDLDIMPNVFDGPKPKLPESLKKDLLDLRSMSERVQSSDLNAIEVSFVKEARNLLNESFKECFVNKKACKAKNDNAGKALWARASEKIAKLALLYAISADIHNPIITCDAVNWARELVHMLINRMSLRIKEWMATSQIERLANKVRNHLRKNNGSASRRDLIRSIKPGSKEMMDQVEAFLKESSDVTVQYLGANRSIYTIIMAEDGKTN